MNPENVKRLGMGANLDAGLLGRIGLDYDLKKKEVCRNLILGISLRDFLPGEIVWINSMRNYREPFRLSQYYGIAYHRIRAEIWWGTGL